MEHKQFNEAEWPVVTEIPVRWGDMDAFNHVNNTLYFRYMETARIDYFHALGLMEMMEATGVGPILAQTSCRFLQPVSHPDRLKVGIRVVKMGNSSMVMIYHMHSERLGLVATGESVVVSYDFNAHTKAPLPDAIRQAVWRLEGKEV
jgi:acyl-CoA thioester hydrolase